MGRPMSADAPADAHELLSRPLGSLCFAAIDFESAGSAPGETDCPVQVGIVRTEQGLFGPCETWVSYIAPTHPVHWSAAKVHGITTERLVGAPDYRSLWPELRRLLSGAVVVGHNPATEQRFLRAFPGHGFGPWLDTLALARRALPQLGDHALGTVCESLGLVAELQELLPGRRWHDALFDAGGSLVLLRGLVGALNMEEAPLRGLNFALKI